MSRGLSIPRFHILFEFGAPSSYMRNGVYKLSVADLCRAGGPGPRGAGRGRNLALLCIKMLSPEALRELLASWLEAQAKAAGAPGQTVPLQVLPFTCC